MGGRRCQLGVLAIGRQRRDPSVRPALPIRVGLARSKSSVCDLILACSGDGLARTTDNFHKVGGLVGHAVGRPSRIVVNWSTKPFARSAMPSVNCGRHFAQGNLTKTSDVTGCSNKPCDHWQPCLLPGYNNKTLRDSNPTKVRLDIFRSSTATKLSSEIVERPLVLKCTYR